MAGKIIADTLETGAGADISTSYVVNGSAKALMYYDHSSNAVDHSFNTSSATDSGTGLYRINYSNNFSQTRPYSMNNAHQMFQHIDGVDGSTTTFCKFKTRDGSKANADSSESCCAIFGDLA